MQDCTKIVQVLKAPQSTPEELRGAVFQATTQDCKQAVPHLVGLLSLENIGIQDAAEQALCHFGGKEAVRLLLKLLRAESPSVRNTAMSILRTIGSQDIQSLIAFMHDKDVDVRIFMADILGTTNSALAVEPLGEALLYDSDTNVRHQAAVSLGSLEGKESIKYLNQALGDNEQWVQFAVIEALSMVGDESSVSALVKTMEKASDLVSSMIVDALAKIGNIKVVNLLLEQMEVSSSALRNKMARAVVSILGPKSLYMLSDKQRTGLHEYFLQATYDDDKSVQDATIRGLGVLGDEKATARILEIASRFDPEKDEDRLEIALHALETIGFNYVLEEAAREGSFQEARVALATLARIREPASFIFLEKIFWNKERDLQREIIKTLIHFKTPETAAFMVDVLKRHTDGNIVKQALSFLGSFHDKKNDELLCSFTEHEYDDVKEAALKACVDLGTESVIKKFRAMATSEEPLQRLMGVYGMGKLGADNFISEIEQALQDTAVDVRKAALIAISDVCQKEGNRWLKLVENSLHDEAREVRLVAIDLLGDTSCNSVEPLLLKALKDNDDWVKIRAIDALSRKKSKAAVDILVKNITKENLLVALKAVEALGVIGGPSAFRVLLKVVGINDTEIQAAAERALLEIQLQEDD